MYGLAPCTLLYVPAAKVLSGLTSATIGGGWAAGLAGRVGPGFSGRCGGMLPKSLAEGEGDRAPRGFPYPVTFSIACDENKAA